MDLKERIKNAGLKNSKIAEKLGVNPVVLSYWLNGTRPMPDDAKERIKRICSKAEEALEE